MFNGNLTKIFALALIGVLVMGCLQSYVPSGANSTNTTAANSITSNSLTTQTNSTGDTLKNAVSKGDSVSVDYEGTLEDGTVFDTSIQAVAEKAGLPPRPTYAPLTFTAGAGQMIPGFDAAVIGMKLGEEKKITIPPENAYGPLDPKRILSINTSVLAKDLNETPKRGMSLTTDSGASGTIVSVNDNETKIDFNHPLAGRALTFRIIVRKIA